MVDTDARVVVIAVNGQVPDGEDLSWLWDVRFEHFASIPWWRPANAERTLPCGSATRASTHTLVHDTVEAIASCPPGHVEVVANYTAFLQLNRTLGRANV